MFECMLIFMLELEYILFAIISYVYFKYTKVQISLMNTEKSLFQKD